FVESASLARVDEIELVLGDDVGKLVADDVERTGEAGKEQSIAVTEKHLVAVPHGVVVVGAVVNETVHQHSRGIDGVSAAGLPVELIRRTQAVVGLVHCGVFRGWLTFASRNRTYPRCCLCLVVDHPVWRSTGVYE